MSFLKFRAVTVMTALLFLPALCFAKPVGTETYKDIIEKAHNLSLQNERLQALNILASALKKENRPHAVLELKKAAQDLSQVFLSDKAQQLYESSLSLKKQDPGQATDKISEALRLEPENSLIVLELARLQIMLTDCQAALGTLEKQVRLVPSDDSLQLAKAQAHVCLEQWKDYERTRSLVEGKILQGSSFWQILEVEHFIEKKNYSKALEILESLQKKSEKYPEAYYWQQSLEQKTNKKFTVAAQKYVMSCKNISVSLYRQYMIDPMLCRRVQEVESDLKGHNGSSD